ncbi:MAG TPA: hypothetical protein VK453_00775 [Micromonosporaceae bacterium]|nr:hypothetical protein [Micromonosporaceae bacterium]
MHPIVEEAAKKAAVAWLTVPGAGPGYAVWCLWIEDSLYVVTGPGEQPAAGLPEAAAATVTLRGDHGGRVVSWPAEVSAVDIGTPQWDVIAPALAAKRLNAVGGPQQTVLRWAQGCQIIRLRPVGEPGEAGPSLPDGSLAAIPPETPAARPARKPFRLHRVRKR